MKVKILNNLGQEVEITFDRVDEYGGHWFTDGQIQYMFFNPTDPTNTDSLVHISYDHKIV